MEQVNVQFESLTDGLSIEETKPFTVAERLMKA